MSKIIRKELASNISKKNNITKEQAIAALDMVLGGIFDELAEGNEIELRRFGAFRIVEMKSRPGRNIHTGESVTIPARNKVVLKPSWQLGEVVNATKK